jgi:pimeloyl-ACP methyl ester carboxylesterase
MRGDFRRYKLPRKKVLEAGFHFLALNPRAHGKSTGMYDFPNTQKDLEGFLEYCKFNLFSRDLPLFGLGHSGGGTALSIFAINSDCFSKIFLASPILDTRRSLFSLYEKNKIEEFIRVVSDPLRENSYIQELLQDPKWLDRDLWNAENLGARLNREYHLSPPPQNQIGAFLENLFIPGLRLETFWLSEPKTELKSEIFLPNQDHWFPKEITFQFAKERQIPVTEIWDAEDHFFRNGWSTLFECVLGKI